MTLGKKLRELGDQRRHHLSERATYVLDDAIYWFASLPAGLSMRS